MFTTSWSVDGQWVTLKADTVTVSAKPQSAPLHTMSIGQRGEWSFPLNGRAYRIARSSEFMGVVTELYAEGGGLVPESERYVARTAAPSDGACKQHPTPAAIACARCGSFACEACLGTTRIHCKPCVAELERRGAGRPRQAVYFAPIVIMGVLGGALGGLLGGAAGSVSYGLARKVQSRVARVLITLAVYALAALVLFAVQLVIFSR